MTIRSKVAAAGLATAILAGTTFPAFAVLAEATTPLNVRTCGSMDCRVVDVLHRGEQVDVRYCEGVWCAIERPGADGWVNANYLTRGGYDDDDITPGIPLDETWRYDVAGNMWTQGAPVMTPGPRFVLPGAHFADGTFIVFSGKLDSCCADPTAGTFAYDPAADDWADLAPPTEPTPRFNHSLAYVEGRNKAIIFGGNFINIGAGGAVDEIWEYVGMRP